MGYEDRAGYLANSIKSGRIAAKWTIAGAARSAGVSPTTWARLKKGKYRACTP